MPQNNPSLPPCFEPFTIEELAAKTPAEIAHLVALISDAPTAGGEKIALLTVLLKARELLLELADALQTSNAQRDEAMRLVKEQDECLRQVSVIAKVQEREMDSMRDRLEEVNAAQGINIHN